MNAPANILQGLIESMPAEQYHSQPHVSNSILSALHKSPAHCLAMRQRGLEPSAAMRAGTLMHCVALEPETIDERYVIKPAGLDGRTKDGKAWIEANAGREIVTAEQMATAAAQRIALLAEPKIEHALSRGSAEASIFWIDDKTGLPCRARPDHLHFVTPKRVIVTDLKSSADVMPEAFARSIHTYGYHRQAAHYTNGLRACGLEVEAFVFAVVSGTYPFIATAYLLDEESAAQGAEEVDDLLHLYAECQRKDEWRAFSPGYQVIGLPRWAKRSGEVEVSYV